MGYKCDFLAISAGIPRDDILSLPEGGPEGAAEAVRKYFGDGYSYDRMGTTDETYPPGDELWVSTWGETVLFSTEPDDLDEMTWSLPDGVGRWELNIHSVVDLCQFRVTGGPYGDRSVELFGGMEASLDEATSGTPLPFEEPYLAGRHNRGDEYEPTEEDRYPLPFHPLDLGSAAVAWMFGIVGETPEDDEVIRPVLQQIGDRVELPMHRFEPVTAPRESEAPRRRSLWQRLTGR